MVEFRHEPSREIRQFVWSLVGLTILCFGLTVIRIIYTESLHLWFLAWNLILAWIPLGCAGIYYSLTKQGLAWGWKSLLSFMAWLLFLPNTFYLVTDFVHLYRYDDIGIIYDLATLAAYSFAGFILGYTSIYVVHARLYKKYGNRAHVYIALVFMLSSFAIYLGRYLRWNSWDVIANPVGLLKDVSGMIVNPNNTIPIATTLIFFVITGSIYVVVWQGIRAIGSVDK